MSEFKSPNFRNEDGSAAPDIVGVTTFTSPYYFVPPSGTTAERPSGDGLAPGMLRFNTDIGRLEVWRGDHWATILGESPNLGVNGALGARGLFGGGAVPGNPNSDVIDYITISTLGNAQDFGNLTQARRWNAACSSRTRGVFGGGEDGPSDRIDYVTFASTGDATDAANLSVARGQPASLSNEIRGIWAGGSPGGDVVDYITIASIGNAVDFGDLTQSRGYCNGLASSVRGVVAGGLVAPTTLNTIDYITIASTGDAQDFGDLTTSFAAGASFSNATRGVFSGGYGGASPYPRHNTIQFITIASTGNSQDFGDATVSLSGKAGCASPTRGISAGGASPFNDTIDYVEINTTGNAIDFGNLSIARGYIGGCSNAHGGL